jgi:aminopeptidase N
MYGAIIYQKAPIVMRHLEALLGADNFRDGLREYLKAHAFGNATWTDLITVLDRRTPIDLQQWSHAWVDQPGRPIIETQLTTNGGKITRLAFVQRDSWGRQLVWPQQLRVILGDQNRSGQSPEGTTTEDVLNVDLRGETTEVARAVGKPAPLYVLPNGEGWGYGEFQLDARSRDYLLKSLPEIGDALTRGSAWVTMWDALLDGKVAPDAFFDLALQSLPREADEQMTSRILGYASNTWWRFLDQSTRTTRAARFESLLREGLAAAKTPSQKASWFGALRNNAVTPGTVTWLRAIWEKKENVAGLPLAEADYTALALELAVREVDGWSAILDTQLTRIENPDRKARFAFVMPALSADPTVRDRWFASLQDVNNRRREPWVLEGLNYLHHPLRAEHSKKYVEPSLALLWEIQKTGDIFFPKRWLDATLGGHASDEVAAMVRAFLKSVPPSYPERLKNITLQSADELYRAADIVKR